MSTAPHPSEPKAITRYAMHAYVRETVFGTTGDYNPYADESGGWVRYHDHLAALSRALASQPVAMTRRCGRRSRN